MSKKLTHLDESGRPRMVDVGHKANTDRVAIAEGWVRLSDAAFEAVVSETVSKGDVLRIAELAGIGGAKRTADLIPLCHPLPIDGVELHTSAEDGSIRIQATVRTHWRTGVEMEALTAVMSAALTVYDMLKAIDKGIRIEGVRLLEKHGGKSGSWKAANR